MIETLLAKTENQIFEELLTEFIDRNGYVPHKYSNECLTIKFYAKEIYSELRQINLILQNK